MPYAKLRWQHVLLGLIIAGSLIANVVWLSIDTRPPRWDDAAYLTSSFKYHEALFEGGLSGFFTSVLSVDRSRPPFLPLMAVPTYFIFGKSAGAALSVNLSAFVVLALATYGLGARLRSPATGVLAAFFVATYPAAFGLSRIFLFDFWDTALVAVSLYWLAKTEGFARKWPSVALGATLGLGCLCRAFFPVFLVGPLSVSVWGIWRSGRLTLGRAESGPPRLGRYLGPALGIATLVAAPWYLLNLKPLIARSLSAAYGEEAVGYGPSNPLTWQALASYFISFVNGHLTLVGLGLFVAGLVVLWRQRAAFAGQKISDASSAVHGLGLLLASIMVSYLFFSTLPSQDQKNITPILPAMAVVSAWGVSFLPRSRWRSYGGSGVMLWLLVQFWLASYGWRAVPNVIEIPLHEALPRLALLRQGSPESAPYFALPQREHWPIEEILRRVVGGSLGLENRRTMARPAVIGIIPDSPLLNANTFTYFATLRQLPVGVTHPGDPRFSEGPEYLIHLQGVDFAVVKTGSPGEQWLTTYNDEILAFLRSPESGFTEATPRFPLPDGSEAILYERQVGVTTPDEPSVRFPTPVRFSDELELIGYDLEDKGMLTRGRAFVLTYYWRALKTLPTDYYVFVHVTVGTERTVRANWDHAPARGRYPTSWWSPGTVMKDQGLYFLPKHTAKESLALRVGVFFRDSGTRLAITNAPAEVTLDDSGSRAEIGAIAPSREPPS
ncbi:MAG: glycosyltransferase family 39 protein [Deltaproteobacteria bacterium]|nr:glycosyltransferase family 39 protein [Deltaproteobacteria bacterium]